MVPRRCPPAPPRAGSRRRPPRRRRAAGSGAFRRALRSLSYPHVPTSTASGSSMRSTTTARASWPGTISCLPPLSRRYAQGSRRGRPAVSACVREMNDAADVVSTLPATPAHRPPGPLSRTRARGRPSPGLAVSVNDNGWRIFGRPTHRVSRSRSPARPRLGGLRERREAAAPFVRRRSRPGAPRAPARPGRLLRPPAPRASALRRPRAARRRTARRRARRPRRSRRRRTPPGRCASSRWRP